MGPFKGKLCGGRRGGIMGKRGGRGGGGTFSIASAHPVSFLMKTVLAGL